MMAHESGSWFARNKKLVTSLTLLVLSVLTFMFLFASAKQGGCVRTSSTILENLVRILSEPLYCTRRVSPPLAFWVFAVLFFIGGSQHMITYLGKR